MRREADLTAGAAYGMAVTSQPVPERPGLDAAWLRRTLLVGGLWRDLEVVAETGSTNADLVEAARSGAPEGLVRVAEHQRAGRGRHGRGWSSPPRAGLAASVLLRPKPAVPAAAWAWLPLLAGVALVSAVREVTGLPAALKWPNDLLVGGRKCAGILAEVAGDAVVVGIGVNVTTRADGLPAPAPGAPAPTSLALAGAPGTGREPLLVAVLRDLESWYRRWRAGAGAAGACGLRAAYLAVCDTAGRPVRALLPGGGELTGVAADVDPEGRLVLRDRTGRSHRLSAGDIVHVRPG
jgi:BirA family transcriptional regulator, biotin operon repressor / biotin---[acetyl-CoA-carboxylase] ligase